MGADVDADTPIRNGTEEDPVTVVFSLPPVLVLSGQISWMALANMPR